MLGQLITDKRSWAERVNHFLSTADICSNINLIYGVWMAVTVLSGIGAFLSLACSIISCVGLCEARPQVCRLLLGY